MGIDIHNYKVAVTMFCHAYGIILNMKRSVSDGIVVEDDELDEAMAALTVAREQLLKEKEYLGLKTELECISDFAFPNFEFRDGEMIFTGSAEELYTSVVDCSPHYILEDVVEEFNDGIAYRHEVATLMVAFYKEVSNL